MSSHGVSVYKQNRAVLHEAFRMLPGRKNGSPLSRSVSGVLPSRGARSYSGQR
jgi:hypothetical protein